MVDTDPLWFWGMTDHNQITLTSNARLSRELTLAYARHQRDRGVEVWERQEIAPITVWLQSLQVHVLERLDAPPLALSTAQSRLLWQTIIETDVLAGQAGLAKVAQNAWHQLHLHELTPPALWNKTWLNEDQLAFQRWANAYQTHCESNHLMDHAQFLAQLPNHIEKSRIKLPRKIVLKGFDGDLPLLYQRIFEAFTRCGVNVEQEMLSVGRPPLTLSLHSCIDARDEITRAVHWAREHIQRNPEARIAIVIPHLDQVLDLTERILRAILDPPSFHLDPASASLWHISLGHPLSHCKLINDILHLLSLDPHRVSQPDLHRLLRSPWIKHWNQEATQRHRFVGYLTDRQPYWVDWQTVIDKANQLACPSWSKLIRQWRKQRLQSPKFAGLATWAEQCQKELSAIGFGFGRPLDSTEHQMLKSWHRILEQFSELDLAPTESSTSVSRTQMHQFLATLAHDTIFREQDVGAPISVLGVREALGGHYDAAWLMQMDQETWPSAPTKDPMIPVALQSKLPGATPNTCLELATRQIQGLLSLAPELEASYAIGNESLKAQPTPLLGRLTALNLETHDKPLPLITHTAIELVRLENDTQAPPFVDEHAKGGVRLLNDQSACPFKAFATHRLRARDHRPPRPGMSPKDRGTLVHDVLEKLWTKWRTSDVLQSMDDELLLTHVETEIDDCMGRFVAKYPQALSQAEQRLESQNLRLKIMQWLKLEKQRDPFRTIGLESSVPLKAGPIVLEGTPDRIDELEGGERIVIDYKTGRTTKSQWGPQDRLRDGQLPIYALTLDPQPTGIAFAKIEKDGVRFDGLSASDLGIPGIKPLEKHNHGSFKGIDEWPELLALWRDQLDELAREFKAGRADVAPANPGVCRYCHLKAVCRIAERSPWLADEEADEDE
jgi:ATP-dependent helicase/nuclease subunit B